MVMLSQNLATVEMADVGDETADAAAEDALDVSLEDALDPPLFLCLQKVQALNAVTKTHKTTLIQQAVCKNKSDEPTVYTLAIKGTSRGPEAFNTEPPELFLPQVWCGSPPGGKDG